MSNGVHGTRRSKAFTTNPSEGGGEWGWRDAAAGVALFLLGFAVRVRELGLAQSVCFDETYFGSFTNCYLNGTYFVDVHPPLGKLILFWGGCLFGYSGTLSFPEPRKGQQYEDGSFVRLRLVNCVFSSCVGVCLYVFLRENGASQISGVIVGVLMGMDDVLVTEGRFILTDGILHFGVGVALVGIGWLMSGCGKGAGGEARLILSAILTGTVMCMKQTAWGLCPMAVMMLYVGTGGDLTRLVRYGVYLAMGFTLIYVGSYEIHMQKLPKMSKDSFSVCGELYEWILSSTEEQKRVWEKCRSRPLLERVWVLTRYVHAINFGDLEEGEEDRYAWWDFVGGWKETLTFSVNTPTPIVEHLCVPNVLIVVMSVITGLVQLWFIGMKECEGGEVDRRWSLSWKWGLVSVGCLMSFLPFAFIRRTIYLYHSAIPTIIGLAGYGMMIDAIDAGGSRKGRIAGLMSVLVVYVWHVMTREDMYGRDVGFAGWKVNELSLSRYLRGLYKQ